MLLLFKQQIQELFDYGKEEFFQKNVMYIPLDGGGGVHLEILRGAVSPGSSNPDPISDQKMQFSD